VISNSHNTNELIQLQLQESYCLLILTYAAPAFNSDVCVTKDLNVCWNNVYGIGDYFITIDGNQLNTAFESLGVWTQSIS